MKITYKNTEADDLTKLELGDIFKRTGDYVIDDSLYLLTQIRYGQYSLINLTTGCSYSYTLADTMEKAFSSFRDSFEKVTEPIELVVG